MSILERIDSPQDLKALSRAALTELAQEIRQLIIETVESNGGHMASNLGVVELTLALHRVFDSPHDRIIFDTSHQCYSHKIITGRGGNFKSIRTQGGISGFFEPNESQHDLTVIGHAGTGPSLALGWAIGERIAGRQGYAVCVLGDGSLTSGIAYEGLSNIIAQQPRNLMVILNDNGMSISPNVGWVAQWRDRWLPQLRNRLELDADFHSFERITEALAPKIPFGPLALGLGKGLKRTIQKTLIPEIGHFWDEMGFNYIGPIDGHNFAELEDVLYRARYSDKVPFVHVLTNKGQGYAPAEDDPVTYHQPGSVPNGKTYSEVFCDTLCMLMHNDRSIVAISAAMMGGTGLAALKPRYPDRIFDVGICEQHAVSMAAGMARNGLKPVICIYSTFLQRAFDQIIHDVCLNDLPVVFGIDRAGIVGQDGKTHHGLFDLAYMRLAPNMVVSAPRDENELRHLLYTALHTPHPFSIRYPRGVVKGVPLDPELHIIPIGSAEVVRPGQDVCLLAIGAMVDVAQQAAEELVEEGIEAHVVDLRFIKPLDHTMLNNLYPHFSFTLVLEEGTRVGGVMSAVMDNFSQGMPLFKCLSTGDTFIEHGGQSEIRHMLGLDPEGVVKAVIKAIGKEENYAT